MERAKDLQQPLGELYASQPKISSLRERVFEQLAAGGYSL
jgi:hypothetical protein